MMRLMRFVLRSIISFPSSESRLQDSSKRKVGVVIPTLAKDMIQLRKAVTSALDNHCVELVIIVSPTKNYNKLNEFSNSSNIKLIFDDNPGFTYAMNLGVDHLNNLNFEFFSGIGDDDVIAPNFLDSIIIEVESQNAQVGLGHCFYVNTNNEIIFVNTSPLLFLRILNLTPNVIPAPGALIRMNSWRKAGGFNPRYKYVADFDFWLKVRRYGKFIKLNIPMSYFRWHDESLTAGNRAASRKEALEAQLHHTPIYQRVLFYTFTKVAYFFADKLMKQSMKSSYKEIH